MNRPYWTLVEAHLLTDAGTEFGAAALAEDRGLGAAGEAVQPDEEEQREAEQRGNEL
jgi:hypothetical protein